MVTRMIRTAARALLAIAALALAAGVSPAAAAPAQKVVTKTATITEATLASRYWVTNPARRAVSHRALDLQPGQIVITDDIARPGGKTAVFSGTFTPTVANGRVTWSLSSATVDGQPASADLVAQINARFASSWARYIKGKIGAGRVTALAITDSDVTVTYTIGK